MNKSLSRLLYLLSILCAIVGSLLLARGYMGSTMLPDGTTHLAHTGSAVIGIVLEFIAIVFAFIAWIGALIRMARLRRWGWFTCLIIFSSIAMLFYIFFGPKTATYPSMSITTPPYGGFGD